MKHYSQEKQDLWVLEVTGRKTGGVFVDIGAHDGYEWSNTLLLEEDFGWTGVCCEPNPWTFQKLRQRRKAACVNVAVDFEKGVEKFVPAGMCGSILGLERKVGDGEVIEVPTDTLVNVLKEAGVREIDYLSVDTEGAEERILMGFPFHEFPVGMMTVERPSQKLHEYILANDYVMVRHCPRLDNFYLRKDLKK